MGSIVGIANEQEDKAANLIAYRTQAVLRIALDLAHWFLEAV